MGVLGASLRNSGCSMHMSLIKESNIPSGYENNTESGKRRLAPGLILFTNETRVLSNS